MNPRDVRLAQSQIEAVRTMLVDDSDERLWLDSLEGETNVFELVSALLSEIEADEGLMAALTEQMAVRKQRRDRAELRISKRREAITAIMECAELDKLALPEATLSRRMTEPKLVVNDPAAVPEEYTVSVPKPSMDNIKAAFTVDGPLPNWLRVDDARPSLTVRRK